MNTGFRLDRSLIRSFFLCILVFSVSLHILGCSASQGDRDTEEADDVDESDESSQYVVEPLTIGRVQQSLANQGCQNVQILQSAEIQDPTGMVLVMTAEFCENYENQGPLAMLVSAVGDEHIQSNTLIPLPGMGRQNASNIEILSFRIERIESGGKNIVYIHYRNPPSSSGGQQFVERVAIGTFDIEALELAVVQPVNFNVRVGRGRLTGEGSLNLEDTDNDGDLDVILDVTTTGRNCGRIPQCRNGQRHCQQTSAWIGRRFDDALQGEDCAFIGQLDL